MWPKKPNSLLFQQYACWRRYQNVLLARGVIVKKVLRQNRMLLYYEVNQPLGKIFGSTMRILTIPVARS